MWRIKSAACWRKYCSTVASSVACSASRNAARGTLASTTMERSPASRITMSGRSAPSSPWWVACSSKSTLSSIPAASTRRRNCISPQRPRAPVRPRTAASREASRRTSSVERCSVSTCWPSCVVSSVRKATWPVVACRSCRATCSARAPREAVTGARADCHSAVAGPERQAMRPAAAAPTAMPRASTSPMVMMTAASAGSELVMN